VVFCLLQGTLIKGYLRTRDIDKAVGGVKGQLGSVSKENLCVLCISKTLEKSGTGISLHVSPILDSLLTNQRMTGRTWASCCRSYTARNSYPHNTCYR